MILPPATIGILGGGQLERMTILAGRRMGYRFNVLEPKSGCSAGMVADRELNAAYEDLDALRAFAREVDLVTLMFENIPRTALDAVETVRPVYPAPIVLHTCQNRLREKRFLSANGFPHAQFRSVESADQLIEAVNDLGLPCVLKSADFGYDGKGQIKITQADNLEKIWTAAGHASCVVEEWVAFDGEYSIICARDASGNITTFPLSANVHRNHILYASRVPAGLLPRLSDEARDLAGSIAESLDVIGLVAVELFLLKTGHWMVNELAPRPHNSGHYTFDACITSQFEQHLRAVCGLPFGSTELIRPITMINLLGDLWKRGEPDWSVILRDPRARLHLYDKGQPAPGRKMGHFCVIGESDSAWEHACDIDRNLRIACLGSADNDIQ